METKTPTLEEVKEYFKNAKEVKCVNSEDIGFIEFEKIEQNRKLDGNIIGYVQNAMTKNWLVLWDSQKGYAEIISYKDEPIDAGSCIKDFETPKHYDNSKGSIYQFCENRNLNSYEFEVIKRIVRCRKKGEFLSDIKKTIQVLEIYLQEQGEKFKGENEILNK